MKYSSTEGSNNKTIEVSSTNRFNQELFLDDPKWGDNLRNYQKLRDIFHYESKVFPKHITTKMVNDSYREFNPITQKYYNNEKELNMAQNSKKNSLSMMSKGFDKQLEVESTYNIINLKNKLAYFNIDDSSKKTNLEYGNNQNQFNYEKNNLKPYNIISNLSLRKHNFVPPELRPENNDNLIKSNEGLIFRNTDNNQLNEKMNNKYGRDFNIINNRYKLFNDEKMRTDKQIKSLIALKKIQNMKKYNFIKGEYLISEEKDNNINNKKVDKNKIIRNPINNIIYDKTEQKRLDEIEYNKKKRFHESDKLDNFRHSISNNIELKRLVDEQNYFNPFEYKLLNKRGYDILTNEKKTLSELNKNLTKIQNDKLITSWDKLKNNSDINNNTFKSKKIYKDAYDESDIDINYSNYMKMRKPILNQSSNTIDDDSKKKENKNIYLLRTPIPNKRNIRKNEEFSRNIEEIINSNGSNCRVYNKIENRIDDHIKYSHMDKDLFFGTPKSVLRKKPKYKLLE